LRLAKEKTRRPYFGNPGGPIMTSPGVCGGAGENAVRPATGTGENRPAQGVAAGPD
jgi:hypothetical protein